MTALTIAPSQFSSQAGGKQIRKGLVQQTTSREQELENYDIRADKSAFEKLGKFRQSLNRDAAPVADLRSEFVSGEESLRARSDYNSDIRKPEVIAPGVKQGRAFLTGNSSLKRADILRNFIKQNNSLTGVTDEQADNLRVTADYTNQDGNLSFAF
ncbi:MAG TPA: hypothetical protein VGC97_12165 [Pyrinomonadaceae bacterium]|jgi:hypothetical protein